jgi:hypothetical protein
LIANGYDHNIVKQMLPEVYKPLMILLILFYSVQDLKVVVNMRAQVNEVRRETAGMQRKILGSWKQYSGREFPGEFQQLPVLSKRTFRKSSEKIRKIPGGNTASMFQIYPVFSCRIR